MVTPNEQSTGSPSSQIVAEVTRGGMVESVHHGHLVALAPDGQPILSQGDPSALIYARSSLKPLQAVAMVRAGLTLSPELLALSCASHSGEEGHLRGVHRILSSVDLDESALRNTADYPYDQRLAVAWQAEGRDPSRLVQNCSGKHAAMLATCVINDWPIRTYLDPSHPLQQRIRDTVAELTGGEGGNLTIDGCGAPLFSCTLSGLAGAFGVIAAADAESPEGRVAAAMCQHPFMVAGTGRDATRLMEGLPGLIAKDGAEGVYAVGLPDGRGVALKILDGSARARPVVISAALSALGLKAQVLRELADVPVLGHGHPVGSVIATVGRIR